MTYSVDWEARIVSIPQSDLIYLAPNRYKLDLDEFRRNCRALEANEGLSYPVIVRYYPAIDTGDVILGRVVLMINEYLIELEDTAERYSALFDGANTNLHNNSLITNGIPTPNNSAGLQDLSTLLASAYQGKVIVDVITGQSGASAPIGTFKAPSGNIPDALTIAVNNGIKDLYLVASTTNIINEDLSAGYNIIGSDPLFNLVLSDAANLTGVSITNLTVTGQLDGLNVLKYCALEIISDVSGLIQSCSLRQTVTLNASVLIFNCVSSVAGDGYATVISTAGAIIQVRDYKGSIGFANITDGDHTIGGSEGRCIVESSCVGGVIHVRGSFLDIIDNSGAGCEVLDERDANIAMSELPEKVWSQDARTLTESSGLSPEESEKLLSIPTKEEIAQNVWDELI